MFTSSIQTLSQFQWLMFLIRSEPLKWMQGGLWNDVNSLFHPDSMVKAHTSFLNVELSLGTEAHPIF